MTPSSLPTVPNVSRANCRSSFVWVAETMVRRRALSRATVGKPMLCAKTPRSNSVSDIFAAVRRLADDHRRDRALAHAGVEAELLEAGLEEARVVPQPLDPLRLGLEDVERREARGGHRRRMRGREQERPGAVVEELDQVARAGHVAAEHADRLRQRADLDVDAAVTAEVIDGAAAVLAKHAARMRIVDHHDRAELFGERAQLRQRGRGRRPSRTRRR